MSTTSTLRAARLVARAAEQDAADANRLRDIIRAYEGIAAHRIATDAANFDGFVSFDDISNNVDVAPADIARIAERAMDAVTSPTHKVLVWGDRMEAEFVYG